MDQLEKIKTMIHIQFLIKSIVNFQIIFIYLIFVFSIQIWIQFQIDGIY